VLAKLHQKPSGENTLALNKSQKILTISIAAYNMEQYIGETLDSITKTHLIEDLEVFVIDDGGNDGTMQIAKKYQELYPASIILVNKENGGWGSTVNYSIEHGSGKYLRLIDGDDFVDSDAFDTYIEYLKECYSDIVCTPYRMFFDNDRSHQRYISLDKSIEHEKEYELSDVTNSVIWSLHALTFKTEVLRKHNIKLLEHCFYTDTEYVTKGFWASRTISFLDAPVYMYRIAHQNRSCGRLGYNKHYKEHERVFKEMNEFKKTLYANHEENALVDKMVNIMAGKQYRVYLMLDSRKQAKDLFWLFERYLKQEEPDLYEHMEMGRVLRVCKKIPYVGFDLARLYYRGIIQ